MLDHVNLHCSKFKGILTVGYSTVLLACLRKITTELQQKPLFCGKQSDQNYRTVTITAQKKIKKINSLVSVAGFLEIFKIFDWV